MHNKYRCLIFTLTLTFVLSSFALERLSLLPQEAQGYVRISNTSAFFDRLKTSPVGKLWADPQVQDFVGNPSEGAWADVLFSKLPEAEKEIMMDQLLMLRGELIVGMSADLEEEYTIAAMSDEDYLRSLEQDEKLSELATNPFEIINDEFQGIKLIRHVRDGGTEYEKNTWQAHLAGTILMGPTREWIERAIIQLKKESPVEPDGIPLLDLKLKVSTLIQNVIQEMEEESPSAPGAPDKKAVFEALGLMGIETYTSTLRLEEDEMVVESVLKVSDLTKGLFTLLDTQPSGLPTVNFIPENISSIEVGRINLLGFWREIPAIFTAVSPEGKMQFDIIEAMIQQQAQIDLRQDLLSNLGTQYLFFSIIDPVTKQPVSVVGIDLKDSTAFKTALETALNAPALQQQVAALLEQEAFLEHTIYNIKTREVDNPLAFSVVAGRLFYGPPEALRRVIRTQSSTDAAHNTFEHSPIVQGLRRFVPSSAFGYRAIDWKQQMKSIVEIIQNPLFAQAFKNGFESAGGTPLSMPDLSTLPPSDHLASFFNISYEYAEQTDDGLRYRIITRY